jgi:uncharacterized protein (TIGR00251 family)
MEPYDRTSRDKSHTQTTLGNSKLTRTMYIKDHKEGVTIRIRVIPRSSVNVLTGETGDCLGVKLTSPPVGGRANRDLVKFIGKKLKIAPSSITILRGHSSREKTLLLSGMNRETVQQRLAEPEKR